MKPKYSRLKVKYLKLGRTKRWGQAYIEGKQEYPIELDERLTGKKHLEILIHESQHKLQSLLSEEEIIRISVTLTHTLWHEGYRRIEKDDGTPLQDGSK